MKNKVKLTEGAQSKSVEPVCAEFLSNVSGKFCKTHKCVSSSLWSFLTFFKLWDWKRVSCHENGVFYSHRSVSCTTILRPIHVWRSTALTTKTKLRVFGSNVKAVLLYGSETWRLTKRLAQKSQVFINKSLRSILRIWWPRKISNKELRRQTGQRPIDQELRQRAWGWIGHMLECL